MKSGEAIFKELLSIPAPSGGEGEVVEYVMVYLQSLGWEVWQDKRGNVYGFEEVDKRLETVVLMAHLDTVLGEGEVVNWYEEDGVVKTDGKTILGADNKAGVAALLVLAGELKKERLGVNVLLFFPVHEEVGRMGSADFEFKKGKVKLVVNVDEGGLVGKLVYAGLSHLSFKMKIKGKAAHAAQNYDEGVNAIVAAAKLITWLRLGVDKKEGWTMNVGKIEGGGKTNVVPDWIIIKGEVRAFNMKVLEKKVRDLEKVVRKLEEEVGVKVRLEFAWEELVPPFEGSLASEVVKLCREVGERLGLPVELKKSWSSSDANSLSTLGYEVVTMARGGCCPHTKQEWFKLEDLNKTKKFLKEVIYAAGSK